MKKKRKPGPQPKGGTRVLVRLKDEQMASLDAEVKRTGYNRSDLIQRAVDAMFMGKRRKSDWIPPKDTQTK